MKDEAVVELAGVCFRRGERTVLDGIDWTVRSGEHWALMGANGSGKTSLLRVTSGYEWPSDGTVTVLGKRLGQFDLRLLRPHIGLATSALVTFFPDSIGALDLVLSGIEGWSGAWREFSSHERQRARETLEQLGAGDVRGSWGVLSQGERQRVMIARALVNHPALLILDEPCAGLDPAGREALLSDLDRLAAGATPPSVVFVTHHVEELPTFVNRALVLRSGRVLAQGAAPEVITSAVLGQAFGCSCEVSSKAGRYRLQVRR